MAFGVGFNLCYKGISWWFLLVIRVIDDECLFSFWYIEVFPYNVHSLVYLCCPLLEWDGVKFIPIVYYIIFIILLLLNCGWHEISYKCLSIFICRIRMRKKSWKSPARIYTDECAFEQDIAVSFNMEFFLEIVPGIGCILFVWYLYDIYRVWLCNKMNKLTKHYQRFYAQQGGGSGRDPKFCLRISWIPRRRA